MRSNFGAKQVASLMILAVTILMMLSFAPSGNPVEPGGRPEDLDMAVNDPYEYAWTLFFFLNRQAQNGVAGQPDPSKKDFSDYDSNQPVVWETWANVTGGLFREGAERNSSEVYLDDGVQPVTWDNLPRGQAQPKVFEISTTTLTAQLRKELESSRAVAVDTESDNIRFLFDATVKRQRHFEIRMNRSTYETIRTENLYSIEGLQAKFREAQATGNRDVISFKPESKQIKAHWVRINPADKKRYHWREFDVQDAEGHTVKELWGLSGLHIVTKDLPTWFWTDFEHVDHEEKAKKEGRESVDPTTRGTNAGHGKKGVRNETVGTKWEYYRLRGVQVAFTDRFGKSTILANTAIEPIDEGDSSCMTCHARATIGPGDVHKAPRVPLQGDSLEPIFRAGTPNPDEFLRNNQLLYIQTDFLWSMPFRAQRQN